MVTDGQATRCKCITFQQSILCPSAVKLIQEDGTCTITENSWQGYCSWKRRRESSIKDQLNAIYYLTQTLSALPPLWNPPSSWQATCASGLPNRVSQIVPQALLMQISTLPSLVPCTSLSLPPTNLSSPSLQFPLGVEIPVEKYIVVSYRRVQNIHVVSYLLIHTL